LLPLHKKPAPNPKDDSSDPAQIILITLAVYYVQEVEQVFMDFSNGSGNAMKDYMKKQVGQLNELIRLTQTKAGDAAVEAHFRSEVGEVHIAVLRACGGAVQEETGGSGYFLLGDGEHTRAGIEPEHGVIATPVETLDIVGGAKAESADG
jgi:hypothetical protein